MQRSQKPHHNKEVPMVTTQSAPVSVDRRSTMRRPLAHRLAIAISGALLGMVLLAGGLFIHAHRPQTSVPASSQPAQATNWRFLERYQLPEITGASAPVNATPLSSRTIRFLEQNDLSSLDSTTTPTPLQRANWRFRERNEILPSSGEVTPEHGPR
jgi:hypothetical protein